MKAFLWVLISLVPLLFSMPAQAGNEVAQADALRARLKLQNFSKVPNLKIAILDNGFGAYQSGASALPASAELVPGPLNPPAPTPHGLGMAQIIWAITGKHPEGPKFYLVNANGFTNFKAAIDFVIEKRVDIVLYSQVWPFGSNFDGGGFINAAVTRAIQSGVLWINAAGNNGQSVYNGLVGEFPAKGLGFENKIDDNSVAITLSWTDFKSDENYKTNQDLDLFVRDADGKLVASSELIQKGEAPPADGEASKLSSYPREAITLPALSRGKYTVQITDRSGNFRPTDRLRVLITSEKPGSVDFKDRTQGQEIMAPADHPGVLTIGDASPQSAVGPTADGRRKPDVVIEDARVAFTNGSETRGSSNAAAIFAGVVASLKSENAAWDFSALKAYADGLARGPGNIGDLHAIPPQSIPTWLLPEVPQDAQVMQHSNGRLVVLTPGDPIELPNFRKVNAYRANADDILIISLAEKRWQAIPASLSNQILPPWVEFRQRRTGLAYWVTPSP